MRGKIIRCLLVAGSLLAVTGMEPPSAGAAETQAWSAWKRRLPVRLKGITPASSRLLPVDAAFTVKAAECPDPGREIRLVFRPAQGPEKEVPFQLSRLKTWDKGIDRAIGEATVNGTITFFDVSGGDPGGTYFILYGNPDAERPSYATDLSVRGEWPAWVIENSKIKVELRKGDAVRPEILHDVFGDCGQIAAVTLKAKPQAPVTNRDRALHWNPGVLIPERGWSNAHAWDPPEFYELEKGPVFVEVRRRGPLPLVPEVELAITYRVFAGCDYVWYGSALRSVKDVGIVSLRTNELVFDEGFMTRLAWPDSGRVRDVPLSGLPKVNRHGDVLRLPPGVPFVAAYDPEKGIGAATVNLEYSMLDPWGRIPDRYDHAFIVVKGEGPIGSGGLFFWFRSFFNFAPEWDRRERLVLPAGWTCGEQSLYAFFSADGPKPLEGVLRLNEAVRDLQTIDVQVGPHPFAPGSAK